MTMPEIPHGFSRHFRNSPLTDAWEPIFSKTTDTAVVIGLWAGQKHCNGRGLVHGGLVSALADNAMGLSCMHVHRRSMPDIAGLVTVALQVDFLRAVRQGQWLEFITTAIKTGRSLDAAQGQVTADGRACAFVSATFSVASGRVLGEPSGT